MNESTQKGIAALKAGDRVMARRWLVSAVKQSPDDVTAWLWLSAALEKDSERLDCLNQVLRIDPHHEAAKKGIAQITQAMASLSPQPDAETQSDPPEAVDSAQAAEDPTEPESEAAAETDADIDERLQAAGSITSSPAQPVEGIEPTSPAAVSGRFIAAPRPTSYFSSMARSDLLPAERIFYVRPSLAPALVAFWGLILGVWLMQTLVAETAAARLDLSILSCGVLGVVLAYLFVKLLSTRYELTTQSLTVPAASGKISMPNRLIFAISSEQSWLQKQLKIADVVVEGAAGGVLRSVRLHDVTDYEKRIAEIKDQTAGIA